ncbi:MAG: hypothetical protein WHS43_00405 [Aquificaceae bacterium]|jgi:chromosome segregation ATPase
MRVDDLLLRMRAVFTPEQVEVLTELIKFMDQLVKATDFLEVKEAINSLTDVVRELALTQKKTEEELRELKEVQKITEQKVAELAEAQKRTEEELKRLSEAQKITEQKVAELAEAQKRTEEELKRLSEAQKITEQKVAELAEAQKRTEEELREYKKITEQRFAELASEVRKTQEILQDMLIAQREMNKKLGGIDQTMGYMLENEAYRHLPAYLEKHLGIKVISRIIREEIGGKEINLLAEGVRNGTKVLIVGEAKSRLSIGPERARDVFEEVEDKIRTVLERFVEYTPEQVLPVIVTHFASKAFLEEAQKQGYIVVQSFEW